MARILIVDDEDSVRRMLSQLVESMGHEVVQARDGIAALELARHQSPDLILLDIDMQGLNGLETLKRLRARDPRTIVIMVSGIQEEPRALKALEEGASDFVRKPFELSRLREILQQHLACAA
ncbi:MAG TPA: response regulator [Candidatus Polarisedimenticolia bacterium]|jgi:CheY-like chemotaxis protein|nr:response regulator [Candidatus Polarisedimenticolia bacterium]